MTHSSLLQTFTTPNTSILFSPLCSSGQEVTLLNCSLFRLTARSMSSPLTSTLTHSLPLPTATLEVNTASTPSFTSGMATSSSCSSPYLLMGLSLGTHLWSTVKRISVFLMSMMTVRNTTLSQLCTRPLERGSSGTKRFQHMEGMVWRHSSTKVILTWQWQTITMVGGST